MSWTEVFSDTYIVGSILLFFIFAALFMAVPIFSHKSIPPTVKALFTVFPLSGKPERNSLKISLNFFIKHHYEMFFGSC